MINAVSDRIRNIIKTQDQTPQSQLYRSRENSIDSHQSQPQIKSSNKTMQHINTASTQLQLNPGPNYLNHPPRSPSKNQSHPALRRSNSNRTQQNFHQKDSENITQGIVNINSKDINGSNIQQSNPSQKEFIQKIKSAVVENIYTLIIEINKKIQHIGDRVGTVEKNVASLDSKIRSIRHQISKQVDEMSSKVNKIENEELHLLDLELARLKDQHNFILRNLSKNISTLDITHDNNHSGPLFHSKSLNHQKQQKINSTSKLQLLQSTPKCKCENLVEQILKSQQHLMMELKYIKHFQNNNDSEKYKNHKILQNGTIGNTDFGRRMHNISFYDQFLNDGTAYTTDCRKTNKFRSQS